MSELSVNNGNFLWLTRGKSWGFRFLSKCSSLSSVVDVVYKALFLRDEGRFGYWKGCITVDGVKKPYVACRCYDSTMQRDEAGRRIPHEFLLLCSDEEYNLLNGSAWESLILEQVRDLYSKRYSLCANEVTDCVIDFSIHLDSSVKPCDSCEAFDVSVPPTVSPTNLKTHTIPRRFPRTILFSILLICLAIGYVAVKGPRDAVGIFLPIRGAPRCNVCIGATPVTNREYAEFVKETGHAAPHYWENGEVPKGKDRNPVLWVSYDDARAYCDWLGSKDTMHGYRLPTEEEWKAVVGDTPTDAPEQTKSVCGGMDFCENAWEWTSTTCSDGTNVVTSGSWFSPRIGPRTEDCIRATADGYADVAFRVIREDIKVAKVSD